MRDDDILKDADLEDDNEQESQDISNIDLAARLLPERVFVVPFSQRPFFPGMVFPFSSNDPLTLRTLLSALRTNGRYVGFVLMKNNSRDEDMPISLNDVHSVGIICRILKSDNNDNSIQTMMQCVERMRLVDFFREGPVYAATVVYPKSTEEMQTPEVRAHTLAIIQALKDVMRLNPLFQEELRNLMSSTSINDPNRLADFAAFLTGSEPEELQKILEEFDLLERLRKVLSLLKKEIQINELKEKINRSIQEKMTKQQREYFLREQLKAIKQELGLEKDEKSAQIERYRARLAEIKMPDDVRQVVEGELQKFELLETHSAEFGVVRNYLDWLLVLPWGMETTDTLDPVKAKEILDKDHYGIEDVKKRILEFISVAKLRGSLSGSILCLVGPPGVGKTSIGKAVAEALGRKFFRFSLGGMRDEAEIKGHRRTYVGAMPGKIIQSLKVVGSQNPVIMLDEIDKIGASFQGDPASALLEVLDPEQNFAFRDHYLDVPFDLTKVLFIATANVPDTIPAPLLDRMEQFRLSGYITEEKVQIAKRHIIPKQLDKHSIPRKSVKFTEAAIRHIISGYAREAGVRWLEKSINSVLRKLAVKYATDGISDVNISVNNVEEFLGKPRFPIESVWKKLEPGVVTGLAWTSLGGATLYVESTAMPSSSGGYKMTGQLGNVMAESYAIAHSFVKGSAAKYGGSAAFFEKHFLHLHVPAGATPKDGPSAGITMASSLVSLMLGKPVRKHLAMTGELTLTGRVLPVGGIKEKVIAAQKNRVKTIILPRENMKDMEEIPDNIREGLHFVFVEHFDEVFEQLFEAPSERKASNES